MKQRDFLLWLLLVPGVGIVGRTRVWEYMGVHGLNELSQHLIGKKHDY